MSLVPKLVQVTVPEGVSPGDTINVEAEGQTVQCQVPEGLKPGDTFQVQTATQPVVPPHAVREGQVVHGSITDEEKHCLDLRFSTRIIAVVDIVLSVLNVIFGSFWALIMVVAAVCGLIGAQVFNGCLVVTQAAAWKATSELGCRWRGARPGRPKSDFHTGTRRSRGPTSSARSSTL